MMQHGPDGVACCGDGAIDLEMTDEALDLVALPIDALVSADRHPAGASSAGSHAGIRPLKISPVFCRLVGYRTSSRSRPVRRGSLGRGRSVPLARGQGSQAAVLSEIPGWEHP